MSALLWKGEKFIIMWPKVLHLIGGLQTRILTSFANMCCSLFLQQKLDLSCITLLDTQPPSFLLHDSLWKELLLLWFTLYCLSHSCVPLTGKTILDNMSPFAVLPLTIWKSELASVVDKNSPFSSWFLAYSVLVNCYGRSNGFLETLLPFFFPPTTSRLVLGSLVGMGLLCRKKEVIKCFWMDHPATSACQCRLGLCVPFVTSLTLF